MRKMSLLLCLMVALALSWPSMYAQFRTGTVSGTVSDSTAAVLPGVEVTVSNLDTGQSRALVTDDSGNYRALELVVGDYEVRAELTGFQTAIRRGFRVVVGQEAVINLTLEVGEISPVLRSDRGFHVFRVTERRVGGELGFEEVRDRLRQHIEQQRLELAYDAWLEAVRDSAYVEVKAWSR